MQQVGSSRRAEKRRTEDGGGAAGRATEGREKYPMIALESWMPCAHVLCRQRRVSRAHSVLSLEFQGLRTHCEQGVDTHKSGAILRALPGKRRFRGAFAD